MRSSYVAFSGYIGNRTELIAKLGISDDCAQPPGDAAIIAAAAERWGHELAFHIDGEFSTAVIDVTNRHLTLLTDEFAVRPLYYAERGTDVYFSDNLECIVEELGPGELDREYLSEFLWRGAHYGAATPFAGIKRLVRGQSLTWSGPSKQHHEVENLSDLTQLNYRDPGEYSSHFKQVLSDAVASATPANAVTWCELSGGLDSSSVFALARATDNSNISAFSFTFSESLKADESDWIKLMLKHCPASWFQLDKDRHKEFSEQPDRFIAEPNFWQCGFAPNSAYHELCMEHNVDVVLTGVGGDAVLFGDAPRPYWVADQLLGLQWVSMYKALKQWQSSRPDGRALLYHALNLAARPALRFKRKLAINNYFHDDQVASWWSEELKSGFGQHPPASPPLASAMPTVGSAAMVEGIEENLDALSKHYYARDARIEFRHPLLNPRLVRFMLSVPAQINICDDNDRRLQRMSLKNVLPKEILHRNNKGTSNQAIFLGLEEANEFRNMLTTKPILAEMNLISSSEWTKTVDRAILGFTEDLRMFLSTVNLESWLRHLPKKRRKSTLLLLD